MSGPIQPPELPKPRASFSHGFEAANMVFVAGQIALGSSGDIVSPDISDQTKQVITNIASVLRSAGLGLEHVASTTVFLRRSEDYDEYDRAYRDSFGQHRPARATVLAQLAHPEAMIEIQAIAVRPSN